MALPILEFEGNLVRDPELRFTPSGVAVVNLSVACNSSKPDGNGGWVEGDTTFINLVAYKDFAENVANSNLTKGTRVVGKAKWKQRSYEAKDGSGKRTVYEGDIIHLATPIAKFAPKEPGGFQNSRQQPQGGQQQPQGNDAWGSQQVSFSPDDEAPF